MESLLVLEQFVESWRHHPGFQVDSFGNATFQGVVTVKFGRAKHQCTTLVRVWQYDHENGKIRIRKDADFVSVFPHVDFSLSWNEYRFRGADHALTISGHSEKLGVNFFMAILPADDAAES